MLQGVYIGTDKRFTGEGAILIEKGEEYLAQFNTLEDYTHNWTEFVKSDFKLDATLTVEDLAKISGYSKGFIYDLTSIGLLEKPVRGLKAGVPGKGTYSDKALHQLLEFKKLRMSGHNKKEAIRLVSGA